MRGLLLYGAHCLPAIWEPLTKQLKEVEWDIVVYPHQLTSQAATVGEITKWVFSKYQNKEYDFIIGHSMGGIIALELVSFYHMKCKKICLLDTNIRPAKAFYRNLLLEENLQKYGERVLTMLRSEAPFYSSDLMSALQEEFDYSDLVKKCKVPILAFYGDRGRKDYPRRFCDLSLEAEIEEKIEFHFISSACHMPMIENCEELANQIKKYCYE